MTPPRPGLLAVAAREVRWIFRDPVARFLLFGVPVIAFTVLGLTFSSAVVRGLNIVVVDRDNSTTSRLFVQTLAAAPGIAIADRANDLGAAASAIRSGRAIAAYAVIMTVCGVGAALVTYGLTGSVWWAVIVLLVAGPVVQTVLRGVWSP